MFNIEIVGLLMEEQYKKFRINDPNNPGRTYISGKGLDFPFELDPAMECMLHNIRYENQIHTKEIIENANRIIQDFEERGIQVLNGRYGPYISFNKKNYRIPKSRKPEELTLEECREIIEKAGSRTKK